MSTVDESISRNISRNISQNISLGYWIRRRRKALDLTQAKLADQVGCAVATIKKIEGDERRPSRQMAERLADCLGIPAAEREAFLQVARAEVALHRVAMPAYGDTLAPSSPVTTQTATPTSHPRHNLPHRLTSFIGRAQEVAALQRLVQEQRLVTLTGVGGVGKSSLALAVANTLAFPDGIWLLELAPITDAGLVARLLADLFRLPESPSRTPLEAVLAYLQPKELLLIVDNCEHLIATCADLVDRLLRSSATLHILATSREALNTAGEREWPVLPLPTPPPTPSDGSVWSLPQLQPFAAAQLLIERAQAVQADLVFTDQDAGLIAHICQQVDGIPLALELAAARCKSFTLAEIIVRLQDRFALLSAGRRTALLRHQTLRTTIDWSYDLLSPAEAALFRSLAVFAGGWTVAAAEQVAAQGQSHAPTFDLLHQLVNKSLVIVDQRSEATRYHLLETLRGYAREKLAEQGEEAAMCERHAAYFLQLAEAARPLLYSAQQQVWYQRLITEQSNFQAALHWRRANENYSQVAQLGAALCWFWLKHGKLREEMPRLEWALAAINHNQTTTPSAIRAKALYSVGTGASWLGDFRRARQLFEACLQVEEAPDAWFELTEVLGALADIAEWEGDYPRATSLNERYLALSRTHNYTQGVADALTNLGELVRLQGDYARAHQFLQESLILRKTVGTVTGVAATQGYLSMAVRELGDFPEAQRLLAESLQIADALEDKMVIAGVTTELGVMAQLLHDDEKARHMQQQALKLFNELGFQAYSALALTRLGNLDLIRKELESAHAYFTESLVICQRIGNKRSLIAGLEGMAGVAALNNRPLYAAHLLGAAAACRQAIRVARPIEERPTYEQTIAVVRAALGDAQFAAAYQTGQLATLDDLITKVLAGNARTSANHAGAGLDSTFA